MRRGILSELADRWLCRTHGWVGPTITATSDEITTGDVIVRAAGRNTYRPGHGWPQVTSTPRHNKQQLVIPLDYGRLLRIGPTDLVELAPTAATVARLGRTRIHPPTPGTNR